MIFLLSRDWFPEHTPKGEGSGRRAVVAAAATGREQSLGEEKNTASAPWALQECAEEVAAEAVAAAGAAAAHEPSSPLLFT